MWSVHCSRSGKVLVVKAYEKAKLKPRQLLNVQRELNLLCFFRSSGCVAVPCMGRVVIGGLIGPS